VIISTDQERWDLYRVLNLSDKLNNGQAYVEVRRTSGRPPQGNFPVGTRSQMVDIRLTINDYRICVAHRYVLRTGEQVTGPDPKYIRIDDLVISQ